MLRPSSVSVGITALRATCQTSTRSSPQAVRARGGDEVRVEHLEHADAQAAHEQRHDRERRRQARQDQRPRDGRRTPAPAPPTGSTCRLQREDLDQDDPEPERRHAEAGTESAAHAWSGRRSRREAASVASGTVMTTANSVGDARRAPPSRRCGCRSARRPTCRRRTRRPSRSVHQIADVADELAGERAVEPPLVRSAARSRSAWRARRAPARAGSPGSTCSSRNVADGDADHDDQRRRETTDACSCARASAQPDVLETVRAAGVDGEAVDLRARRVDVRRVVERDERCVLRDDRLDLRVERRPLGAC